MREWISGPNARLRWALVRGSGVPECAALKPFKLIEPEMHQQRDGDARCDSVGSASVVEKREG